LTVTKGKEFATLDQKERIFICENVELNKGVNYLKVAASDGVETVEDMAMFNKVQEPNPSYVAPVDGTGTNVENWFEMPDIGDVEVEELEIPEGVYSMRSSFRELFQNEAAKSVVIKYLGNIEDNPMFSMMQDMTIEQMATLADQVLTKEVLYLLNKELIQIKKDS